MKTIAITGYSGFVGTNLIAYLNGLNQYRIDNIDLRLNSVFDISAECETFIHLAGKAHDLKKSNNPQEYYKVNTELTKNVFDTFIKSNAKTFVMLSSVKAVADEVTGNLAEDTIPNPKTHYGKSKLLAEQYIQNQLLPEGKSYYILRPCMIHGPGNKGNLNLLYKIISKGIPYPLAAFENRRSFLSIENLCFVISELLERDDVPSGVYNVADDEPLSTNELIRLIGKVSNKAPLLWNVSPKLIRGLARLGDMLKLPLTTERLDKLTENYVVDNSKIRAALGKDLPIRSRDGIITTIQSFQNQAKQ